MTPEIKQFLEDHRAARDRVRRKPIAKLTDEDKSFLTSAELGLVNAFGTLWPREEPSKS